MVVNNPLKRPSFLQGVALGVPLDPWKDVLKKHEISCDKLTVLQEFVQCTIKWWLESCIIFNTPVSSKMIQTTPVYSFWSFSTFQRDPKSNQLPEKQSSSSGFLAFDLQTNLYVQLSKHGLIQTFHGWQLCQLCVAMGPLQKRYPPFECSCLFCKRMPVSGSDTPSFKTSQNCG